MSDAEFRQAMRAWHAEGTSESKERVIVIALRQGMTHWDIFEFMLGSGEIPFHEAVAHADDEYVRSILRLLASTLSTLEMNSFSSGSWSTGEQDEQGYQNYVGGTQYNIGFVDRDNRGTAYILEDETKEIYRRQGESSLHLVNHQDTIDEVLNQRTQDMLIVASRYYLAKQAAGDSQPLYHIFHMNINFSDGTLDEPTVVDGIPFWQVGRNASHGFYMGYSDGQLYRMSEGYEWDDQGNSMLDRHVTPVEDFGGYMGHF